ncbi:FAD/NAD-P-binding domain-containing protein [Trametes versicolor FP-101664 SS1]|uniref:FAD/NAD-P-binding domain-containing protein n=1 Tax=Trametes versicolor (strain FP-101664) TaxID=717944 RepID=UPI0004622997|nr:FAD/NAD-P-binding domain-containing protein [Trametes versicolor FP-101664 SS1]EIW53855.1 FAD/NAD-P-binding domain-containing protein [Trametes versicolor FP-101664 SS1]
MTITLSPKPLRVAIVGAGPGGLAATIQLSRLKDVELSVFDQARELREVGAGISLNENTWRLLQDLGAAHKLEQFVQRGVQGKLLVEHRNGRTGELLAQRHHSGDPDKPPAVRIERYKLQNALLSQIPPGLVQLSKKLVDIRESADGVSLEFADGTTAGPFDLIVGADGIRSVVRQYAFPEHKLTYTGRVAYRVLIHQEQVAHLLPDLPHASCFWHTRDTHIYTNVLDNGLFEIATRAVESEEHGNKVSWGQTVPREQVVPHYQSYCPLLRKVIDAPDEWLEFAMFGGPRLASVTHNGRIVLIGDASHPLSGAFGSGAAFAFEDAYALKHAIDFSRRRSQNLNYALELFDTVRAPRYKELYGVLDTFASNVADIKTQKPDIGDDEYVAETTERNWQQAEGRGFIYGYNIANAWAEREAIEEDKLHERAANLAVTLVDS